MRHKAPGLVLVLASMWLVGPAPMRASCVGSAPAFQGFAADSLFQGCGLQPEAFAWAHKRGVQRLVGGAGSNGAAGIDSGTFSRVEGAGNDILQPHMSGQLDAFTVNHDYGNTGLDGCPLLTPAPEPFPSCARGGTQNFSVVDVIVSGHRAMDPFTAYAAVLSVDGNEPNDFWILDQAGAVSVDGDPCGADSVQFKTPGTITCGAIPKPDLVGLGPGGCTASGCELAISVGPHSVPLLDDCLVAHDKLTNCPRNLDGGRRLFFQRGSCASPPTDTRAFTMRSVNVAPFPGTVAVNMPPYSLEDGNLNGALDPGEDGSHGQPVNGELDPVTLPGNLAATTTITIPNIPGATDCVYLGVGLVVDGAPISPGESVISPFVTINPIPISLENATPISDRVLALRAVKSGGKATISWITAGEFTIAGFDLIGFRRDGRTLRLNSTLIAPRFGTTAEGASYTIDLSAGDVKGSSHVAVEVKHTNGSTDRTDPVPFE